MDCLLQALRTVAEKCMERFRWAMRYQSVNGNMTLNLDVKMRNLLNLLNAVEKNPGLWGEHRSET